MADQKGMVIDSANGWAQLVTERRDACGGCSTTQSCSACLSGAKVVSTVLNPVGAKSGDVVVVSLSSKTILKSAAIVYLLPIFGLMVGAVTGLGLQGYFDIGETALSVAFGLAGLVLGFLIVFLISRRISVNKRFAPVISRILKSE